MNSSTPPPDISSLLPHEGVARFVESILHVGENRIKCTGRISADSPLATGEQVPAFALVELVAQAAALLESCGAMRVGAPSETRGGYLVRVRHASFTCAFIAAEQPLTVYVERTGAAAPLFMYDTSVVVAGEQIFSGSISTFAKPE